MTPNERFLVEFKARPPGRDHLDLEPTYRLKMLLKRALRAWGLRCVKVTSTDENKGKP